MTRKFSDAIGEAERGAEVREYFDLLETLNLHDLEQVELGSLTVPHLMTLGGTRQAAFDTMVAGAWARLKPIQRWQVNRTARKAMLRSGTLIPKEPGQDKGPYSISPKIAIIMAARMHPSFVATFGYRQSFRGIRVFGIGDAEALLRGCLVERPTGEIPSAIDADSLKLDYHPLTWSYDYLLATAASAAGYLAGMAMIPPDDPAERGPRLIRLYRPPVRDGSEIDSLAITGGRDRVHVVSGVDATEDTLGVDVDVEGLSGLVHQMLTVTGAREGTEPVV